MDTRRAGGNGGCGTCSLQPRPCVLIRDSNISIHLLPSILFSTVDSCRRSGPRTVVKSTSVFACFEPLGGPCFCLKKQNSCAKNRSSPLDRIPKAIPCEVLAYLCLREQESFLTPHIGPAGRAIDASSPLSLSGRMKCIRLMLCLSFYQWRCIYPGEQMNLAPFLKKTSLDRAPGRSEDNLLVPKHAKADLLLTTDMGPLRGSSAWSLPSDVAR